MARLQNDEPVVIAVNRRGVITRFSCQDCGEVYKPGDELTEPFPSMKEAEAWWQSVVDDTRTHMTPPWTYGDSRSWDYLLPITCSKCGRVMQVPWIKAIYFENTRQHPEQCRWSSGCGNRANPRSDDGLCASHQAEAKAIAIDRDGEAA